MTTLADSFNLVVETEYVEELSVPTQHRYFFTYTITLTNPLGQPVSLTAIKLLLTSSDGEVIELNNPFGDENNVIQTQNDFCYGNDIITASPLSIVQGQFELKLNATESIVINIDPFRLVTPNLLH